MTFGTPQKTPKVVSKVMPLTKANKRVHLPSMTHSREIEEAENDSYSAERSKVILELHSFQKTDNTTATPVFRFGKTIKKSQ